MKIFITGGTGFIGQHLIQLLSENTCELYVLSRKQYPQFWCDAKKVHLVHGDLAMPETYRNILSQCNILVNLAAEIKDEKQMVRTNIEGVKTLVAVTVESGIKKIIHLSSVGVVGAGSSMCKRLVNELVKCNPGNAYEVSKLESENIFLSVKSKCNITILRPTNVFGDHHARKFLLSLFTHARKGKLLIAARNSKFNYVYAGDIAYAISAFINSELPQGIYNVGSPVSTFDFFAIVRKHTKSKSKIILLPALFFYPLFLLKLIGKRELFGKIVSLANKVEFCDSYLQKVFTYKFGLDEGIRRTVDYYERSGFFKN